MSSHEHHRPPILPIAGIGAAALAVALFGLAAAVWAELVHHDRNTREDNDPCET